MNDIPAPIPMDKLRAASTVALIAPLAAQLAGISATIAEAARAQIAQEQAEMKLRAIAQPAMLDELLIEVDRRAEVYRKAWAERPDEPPRSKTPKGVAFETVADDVASGRLG